MNGVVDEGQRQAAVHVAAAVLHRARRFGAESAKTTWLRSHRCGKEGSVEVLERIAAIGASATSIRPRRSAYPSRSRSVVAVGHVCSLPKRALRPARALHNLKDGKKTMALDVDTRIQLIEAVRRFVAERLERWKPRWPGMTPFPDEVVGGKCARSALFGLSIPKSTAGWTSPCRAGAPVAIPRLRRTPRPTFSSAFGTPMSASAARALVMFQDARPSRRPSGSPKIASGELITSFCALTEPEAGIQNSASALQTARGGTAMSMCWTRRRSVHHQHANKARPVPR